MKAIVLFKIFPRDLVFFCFSSFPVACAAVVGEYNAPLISFFLWLLNRHLLCHIKHSSQYFLATDLSFLMWCHAVALLLHCSNQSPTVAESERGRLNRPIKSSQSPTHSHSDTQTQTRVVTWIRLKRQHHKAATLGPPACPAVYPSLYHT